ARSAAYRCSVHDALPILPVGARIRALGDSQQQRCAAAAVPLHAAIGAAMGAAVQAIVAPPSTTIACPVTNEAASAARNTAAPARSEEHTPELQSRENPVS